MYSKQTEVYDACACALANLFAPSKRASTKRGKYLGRRGYIPACIISPGRNRNCRAVWIEWAPQRPLNNLTVTFFLLIGSAEKNGSVLSGRENFCTFNPFSSGVGIDCYCLMSLILSVMLLADDENIWNRPGVEGAALRPPCNVQGQSPCWGYGGEAPIRWR